MQDSGYFQKLTQRLIHTYYVDQDWNAALSYFDQNQVSWIGVSDKAMALDYEKLRALFENGRSAKYETRLLEEHYNIVGRGEDFTVVIAQLTINLKMDKGRDFNLRQRASFIFHLCDSEWKVTHVHTSAPISSIGEEEFYPEQISIENYRLLEKLLSEIKETIGQLELEKERNEIVSELSDDIIFDYKMIDDELQVFYPASITGEKHKKIIKNVKVASGWKELGISSEDEETIYNKIKIISKDKISNKTVKAEYQIVDGEGGNIWRRVLMRGVFNSKGNLAKVVGKVVDISSEKELMLRSNTDSLTSAYNRNYLELAAKKAIRNKGSDLYYACLLIDIDHFKEINDKFGHLRGDCVLIEVVKMCRTLFRSTDIIARLGGDEFMIFMRDIYDRKIVLEKAQKILNIAENYRIEEKLPDRLSLSIGIVIDDDRYRNYQELYHQADIALYHAKQNGRGRYMVFEEGMMHPSDQE